MLFEAEKAKAEGMEVFPWERERIADADPKLVAKMETVARQSVDGRLGETGTQIHDLIDKAFKECENDIERIPDWFVDNLPKIRSDIQPAAIRHARHIADMLANFRVNVIATEKQLSVVLRRETEMSPPVIGTMRYDLLGFGLNSLHIVDWKTGFKRRTMTETADSFQAQFGAWLLWQQKEYAEIETVHFWYYETLWGTKSYARFDRTQEHPRLPHLTTDVAIAGRVNSAVDAFLANRKDCWPLPDKCAWCDMIRYCPMANLEAAEIAKDPKGFIDKLVADEALLKRRKKTATEWIKAKGPLEGSKVVFSKKKPAERFTTEFQDKQRARGPARTGEAELDKHFG